MIYANPTAFPIGNRNRQLDLETRQSDPAVATTGNKNCKHEYSKQQIEIRKRIEEKVAWKSVKNELGMNYLRRPGHRLSSQAAEPSPEQVNLRDLEATQSLFVGASASAPLKFTNEEMKKEMQTNKQARNKRTPKKMYLFLPPSVHKKLSQIKN